MGVVAPKPAGQPMLKADGVGGAAAAPTAGDGDKVNALGPVAAGVSLADSRGRGHVAGAGVAAAFDAAAVAKGHHSDHDVFLANHL